MFEDFYRNGIILRAPDVELEVPLLLGSVPAISEDAGWDEAAMSYVVRTNAQTTPEGVLAAFFPQGQAIAGQNLWVRRAVVRERAEGLYTAEVTARGRIGGLRFHTKVDAVTQQGSQANTVITAPEGYPFTYPTVPVNARSNEGALTFKVRYVDLVAPDYTKVSETAEGALNPPAPTGYPARPTGPANKWTGIVNAAWIYPAGWVLEARAADAIRLPNGTEVAWAVEDTWVYYHVKRPNG
jgi:hypothetical protein